MKYKKILLSASAILLLSACNGGGQPLTAMKDTTEIVNNAEQDREKTTQAAEEETVNDEDRIIKSTVFESNDGWQMTYNPTNVEATQVDDHSAKFVYTGEGEGESLINVKYIQGKQPEAVLDDLTSEWGKEELVRENESFFPGTYDRWAYWRVLPAMGDLKESHSAIAGEYNGGVLLFECVNHKTGKDEIDMAVSDILSNILNSVSYQNFEPQTMYSNIPGTYNATDGFEIKTITLNEDHTGTLTTDNDIQVRWGSKEIMSNDGSVRYGYTIEGDSLIVDYEGATVTLNRE